MLSIGIAGFCLFLFPQLAFSQQHNMITSNLNNHTKENPTIGIAPNLSRIEILLKNNQSNNPQSSQTNNYINAIIAAGGAIGGATVGSYLTYRSGKKIEERKAAIDTKKEEELNVNIINMVHYELQTYSDFLTTIIERSHTNKGDPPGLRHLNEDAKPDMELRIQTFPIHYTQLTIERKLTALGGKAMARVETAYKSFHEFTSAMKQNPDDFYESNVRNLRETIGNALESMKM